MLCCVCTLNMLTLPRLHTALATVPRRSASSWSRCTSSAAEKVRHRDQCCRFFVPRSRSVVVAGKRKLEATYRSCIQKCQVPRLQLSRRVAPWLTPASFPFSGRLQDQAGRSADSAAAERGPPRRFGRRTRGRIARQHRVRPLAEAQGELCSLHLPPAWPLTRLPLC